MQPFTTATGIAAPLMRANIDTDAIIAARAGWGSREQLGSKLFTNWRFDLNGNERAEFVLNQPRYRQAAILVAGRNFGCGSSRELAVWALLGFGIRAVIAPSFGKIFYENALQNGLLPVRVSDQVAGAIAQQLERAPLPQITVDLERQVIELPDASRIAFELDAERRRALLLGQGDLGILIDQLPRTEAFESRERAQRPWMYGRGAHRQG